MNPQGAPAPADAHTLMHIHRRAVQYEQKDTITHTHTPRAAYESDTSAAAAA